MTFSAHGITHNTFAGSVAVATLVCMFPGDESFAPNPRRMEMFLEYQTGPDQPWQSMQFFMLGVLIPQGPFVQQLEVPLGINV